MIVCSRTGAWREECELGQREEDDKPAYIGDLDDC